MSPEIQVYLSRGYKKRDKGRISEVRAFDILIELPEVTKVEPTEVGGFYDADIYFSEGMPLPQVKLEVKSSETGVSGFSTKVKEKYHLPEDKVDEWLLNNLYVVLVVGFELSKKEIMDSFYDRLATLINYQARMATPPEGNYALPVELYSRVE